MTFRAGALGEAGWAISSGDTAGGRAAKCGAGRIRGKSHTWPNSNESVRDWRAAIRARPAGVRDSRGCPSTSERIRRKIDRRPAIEVRLSTASQPPHHCQGPVARHLPRHYLELLCSGRRGRRPWRRRATGGGEEGGSGRGGLGASGRAATLQHLPQQRLRSYPFKSPLALPVPPPVMGTNYSNWNRRRHPITGAPGWWWWWWPPRGCSGVR